MEILWLVWFVFSPIACWIIASSKARSSFGWLLAGAFFGLFAVFIVAVLPSRARYKDGSMPTPDTHVKCPDCRELVLSEARVCKHCGCKLIPQEG